MEYMEIHLHISPKNQTVNDLLASTLGETGFESFMECEDGLLAYIPSACFDESEFNRLIGNELLGSSIQATREIIPDQDWNSEWEKNDFEPIWINRECVIHSSAQKDVPSVRYDILINPKMSFGTGHHETTGMMLEELLKLDVNGKSFLDMGCGTAVLAILASMKGAGPVLGIDVDEWAVNNALENIRINGRTDIEIRLGDARLLNESKSFDLLFANIHRNILINDMDRYEACMHRGSSLFMSGFYEEDIPALREKAESLGLHYQGHASRNQWVAIHFMK